MSADEGTRLLADLMRFRPDGLTANAWAVKAGVSRNVWNDLQRHGNPSRRTLEKLLAAADSSLAEFEALRIGDPPAMPATVSGRLGEGQGRDWLPSPLPSMPLLPTASGGEWGRPGSGVEMTAIGKAQRRELVARPASLASDPEAFAVTIIGESMWPRFRPGRRIAISPRSPVAIGDDVAVRLAPAAHGDGGELVLIKELVGQTADAVELRQFSPDLTFRVERPAVVAIHKVAGELF
jgi:hypothetical protein